MFSLSAQQSYSSLANSPAAILSVWMQYSQHGYHKALLSSVPLTGFASILCQYHTALTEPEYSTLTERQECSWNRLYKLCLTTPCENSCLTMSNSKLNLTCFVDAHAGASRPTVAVCSATWSHVSMWWEQTCFVCFHNLLVDHLRPSEQPGLQCKRGRKPGLGTKQRTKPSLPPGRASFPHKVRLQWKCMTFGSIDTAWPASAFPPIMFAITVLDTNVCGPMYDWSDWNEKQALTQICHSQQRPDTSRSRWPAEELCRPGAVTLENQDGITKRGTESKKKNRGERREGETERKYFYYS